MKKRLLITGASGFLGWNICKIASSEWQVYGICYTNNSRTSYPSVVMNLTDYYGLKNIFNEIQPNAVIHAAAASDPNYCQIHPDETRKINVDASANIAGLCADADIPCVFTSSDLIFDGLNPPYSEKNEINPISVYGEQKSEAEKAMQRRYPETAICRMPLMFGYTEGSRRNFFFQMIQLLRERKSLRLFTDEYRTPVDAESAAEGLLFAVKNIKGIIHLGGKKRISRYEMGKMLVRLLNLDESMLIPVLQKDILMPAPRPHDVSLDSTNAYKMGYNPQDIEDACRKIIER